MELSNHDLRKKILARRNTLPLKNQNEKSKKIIGSLLNLPEIQRASTLFVYVNFRSEVQTISFIKKCLLADKRVAVPVTHVTERKLRPIRITDPEKDLQPGYCNILEPNEDLQQTRAIDPASIEVVIVPGSVFDKRGGRLGYGGGYYDRFLALAAPQARRIAPAYALQVVEMLKLQPHDQTMDLLITEDNSYSCGRE
ncbi:MAG TPA: 5-formyltetrahydrofolate cyclo-ligase [Desulfobulbaceae bacterium]|nr:5-formyltetrahydrofolate cyclo-ligase [Desulfobulbaceae bacterium]